MLYITFIIMGELLFFILGFIIIRSLGIGIKGFGDIIMGAFNVVTHILGWIIAVGIIIFLITLL